MENYIIYSKSQKQFIVETGTGTKTFDTIDKLIKWMDGDDVLMINVVQYY